MNRAGVAWRWTRRSNRRRRSRRRRSSSRTTIQALQTGERAGVTEWRVRRLQLGEGGMLWPGECRVYCNNEDRM